MAKYRQILLLLAGALFFFVLGGVVLARSFQTNTIQTLETSEVKSVSTGSLSTTPENASNLVKVSRVVDGDTIVLEGGQVLRYIGIDTPETVDPRQSVQCFGVSASSENKKLVEGKLVRLEKDVSETDRYGRLLRYVYIDPETSSGQVIFVNDYLVKEGFAHSSSYPPDIKYQNQFSTSESEARSQKKGLWSECDSSINQTATPTVKDTSVRPTSSAIFNNSSVDCSNNVYNCSSFSSQAEAQNAFDTCGGSSNDIHKLDRDGDGRVCETLP